jgi:N6-adenosine-specific RNA methylase IME4/ParB-like chromosome segregation protein Spo0J
VPNTTEGEDTMASAAAHPSETEDPKRLRPHPQAGLIPGLTPDEYRALLADIERRGIVTPLEITSAGVVLDGHQRLRAALELGLDQAPVRVIAPANEVAFMLLAALRCRQLTASQRATLALELEEIEQASAQGRERRLANLRPGAEVATLPPRGERTREIAARLAGVSARTVQDAATVRAADLELFQQVKEGSISADRAARRIRQRQLRAALPLSPPLPQGPFQVIYADPPWQLPGDPESAFAPENHYPTMPLADITALTVPAADEALLFLWAVNCLLPQALEVMAGWGFTYVTNLVWVKPSIGLGRWVRNRHELLLVGRKGGFPAPEHLPDSVVEAARGRHSEKPACVYGLIERMCPGASKVELFARGKPRPGWIFWGNEVDEQ